MRTLLSMIVALWMITSSLAASPDPFEVDREMAPPEWALLQRALLDTNSAACEEFFEKYFDERGYLECVERWGGDDGPDDAIENCHHWPLLHALGGRDSIRQLVNRAWEGHLRQYTQAKTKEVPFALDGMYYKEFPCMFDWQHNNEGLLVFHLMGLSAPDAAFQRRARRFAGFYMNEDPGAANYDPEHKIIRSLFNGSRGPLLRKATALDWAGDPIEVEHRFRLGHGERSYEEMLAHFEDYNDIIGDHPLNLLATSLAMNAFMVTGEAKYREWLLAYVDAWRQRMRDNHDIIPSNIGLDGRIGGACDGKWYGGTYGWGFTVVVPQTGELAHRNRTYWGFTGFMNAFMLTGDDKYLAPWRRQRDAINEQAKQVDGVTMYPRMYGDQGWYGYVPQKYAFNNLEIYYLSMRPADRAVLGQHEWLRFLEGDNPDYPVQALRRDLLDVRRVVQAMRQDPTTPDTRLADDPMKFNPARVKALRELMLGGIDSGRHGSILHSRFRYFDPIHRRAGIPTDVAALVEKMDDQTATLLLVNVNQIEPREIIVQSGAYAEHQMGLVKTDAGQQMVGGPRFRVILKPGTGTRFQVAMKRYQNQPTLQLPW